MVTPNVANSIEPLNISSQCMQGLLTECARVQNAINEMKSPSFRTYLDIRLAELYLRPFKVRLFRCALSGLLMKNQDIHYFDKQLTSNFGNADVHLKASIDHLLRDIIPFVQQNLLEWDESNAAELLGHYDQRICSVDICGLGIIVTSMRAKLAYFSGDYSLAENFLRLLEVLHEKGFDGNAKKAAYHNNLGCIYMNSSKWILAEFQLSKSLEMLAPNLDNRVECIESIPTQETDDDEYVRKFFPLRLSCVSYRISVSLYNYGLILLKSGRSAEAFKFFLNSGHCRVFQSKPYIWIRLAECCIHNEVERRMKFTEIKNSNLSNGYKSPLGKFITAKVVPSLRSPRIQLKLNDHDLVDIYMDSPTNSEKQKEMSLQNAVIFLTKALEIVTITLKEVFESSNGIHNDSSAVNNVKISILMKLSYLHLKLKDGMSALKFTEQILGAFGTTISELLTQSMPSLSLQPPTQHQLQCSKGTPHEQQVIFLTYCYHIEALTMLGSESEALDILTSKRSLLMSFIANSDILSQCYNLQHQNSNIHVDKRKLEAAMKQMAIMTLQVNCAVVLIVKDQVEMAERLLVELLAASQFMDGVNSLPIIRCLLYVYMRLGKNGKVLNLLQNHHLSAFPHFDID
eukprot:CAMPEP_0170097134 /NCGR_PEP_ID=MMETSP0019_2-20121128/29037_1 /TAXON_ID=98059 /ORGANISM="Dinobryon sp., Strain UTEXLB2267" /LENGTH=628 /DNA_ID=CAMNT_0010319331 /DNA_START=356 /DNA_END=2242 /DNA_ORIENTATION=+